MRRATLPPTARHAPTVYNLPHEAQKTRYGLILAVTCDRIRHHERFND